MIRAIRQLWTALVNMVRGGSQPLDGDMPVGMLVPRPRSPHGGRSSQVALDEPREVRTVVAVGRRR